MPALGKYVTKEKGTRVVTHNGRKYRVLKTGCKYVRVGKAGTRISCTKKAKKRAKARKARARRTKGMVWGSVSKDKAYTTKKVAGGKTRKVLKKGCKPKKGGGFMCRMRTQSKYGSNVRSVSGLGKRRRCKFGVNKNTGACLKSRRRKKR